MFIKRKTKGGFINPAYEKFDKVMGIVIFTLVVILFIALVVMCFNDLTSSEKL